MAKAKRKAIISCAITGSIHTPSMSPHLPVTPEEIITRAEDEDAHVIGLSILSGSHVPLIEDVMARIRERGLSIPVVVGGIIPDADAVRLEQLGVAKVYTPKDFDLNRIMFDIVALVDRPNQEAA